jgi:cell fate regulator YaaT (PSP1 superfamily)
MNKIVGVRCERSEKIYNVDTGHFVLHKGDKVLVDTDQGPVYGTVCDTPKKCCRDLPDGSLKKILRLATKKDIEKFEKNRILEKDIYVSCYEKIKEKALPMNLISVELVKDLVQKYHVRIEMRQIGVRHEAKMVGGLGNCGRQLCCTSFLTNFEPVSIKMAKEQNLSLNPSKISGMCGRLMCCLNYEHTYYEDAKKDLPKIGKKVSIPQGEGKVVRQNILKRTLTVTLESGEEIEVPFKDFIKDEE